MAYFAWELLGRYKLTANVTKTKVMIFRKGGRVNKNIMFVYYVNANYCLAWNITHERYNIWILNALYGYN